MCKENTMIYSYYILTENLFKYVWLFKISWEQPVEKCFRNIMFGKLESYSRQEIQEIHFSYIYSWLSQNVCKGCRRENVFFLIFAVIRCKGFIKDTVALQMSYFLKIKIFISLDSCQFV